MALHGTYALPALQPGIGLPGRAEINPDVMRAELISPIHVNLVQEQKKISFRGLIQFLVTAARAMSSQAGRRVGIIDYIANLDSHD